MTETIWHPSADAAPQVGQPAPSFVLPDETGKVHSLEEGRGQTKPIVLIFMRGEW
jgi:peroxiredoxin